MIKFTNNFRVKKNQQLAKIHQLRNFQRKKIKKRSSKYKILKHQALTLTAVLDHFHTALNLLKLLSHHRVSKIEQNLQVLKANTVRQHSQLVAECLTQLFLTLLDLDYFLRL